MTAKELKREYYETRERADQALRDLRSGWFWEGFRKSFLFWGTISCIAQGVMLLIVVLRHYTR